jgi:hypothetical protein
VVYAGTLKGNGLQKISLTSGTGNYIVRLTLDSDIITKKVFINQ